MYLLINVLVGKDIWNWMPSSGRTLRWKMQILHTICVLQSCSAVGVLSAADLENGAKIGYRWMGEIR